MGRWQKTYAEQGKLCIHTPSYILTLVPYQPKAGEFIFGNDALWAKPGGGYWTQPELLRWAKSRGYKVEEFALQDGCHIERRLH